MGTLGNAVMILYKPNNIAQKKFGTKHKGGFSVASLLIAQKYFTAVMPDISFATLLWRNSPVTNGFPLIKGQPYMELWCILCCYVKQTVEEAVDLSVIWKISASNFSIEISLCNMRQVKIQLEIVDQWSTRIPPPHMRGWHCSKSQGSHFESDIADNR